jgi:hypothetical protein
MEREETRSISEFDRFQINCILGCADSSECNVDMSPRQPVAYEHPTISRPATSVLGLGHRLQALPQVNNIFRTRYYA